jgi:hypothetical protein
MHAAMTWSEPSSNLPVFPSSCAMYVCRHEGGPSCVKKIRKRSRRGSRAILDGREETWRMGDLPAGFQAELGARMIQAERGEGFLPYDEALADVERMTEEILAIGSAASW